MRTAASGIDFVPVAARRSVASMFFINGALMATWAARIPAIQVKYGLSNAGLGFGLLAAACGAVVAMPLAGSIIGSVGSDLVCKYAVGVYGASLPCLALMPGTAGLFTALICFGAAHGALDVAMNAQAVAVERRYRRPIMSSFHALFSVGGLVGSSAGGALAGLGFAPREHFFFAAIVLGTTAAFICPFLLAEKVLPKTPKARLGFKPRLPPLAPGFVALGALALCSMMGEGAMADWSAVFLRNVRHTTEAAAAGGYAAFAVAMALGRVCGDRVTARVGPIRLVRAGGTVAALGLAGALLIPNPIAAFVGFASVGLGFATIIPIVFSAAGQKAGTTPGIALAVVTTLGYFGFIAGPPLIGLVSEFIGLRLALGIIVATSLCAVALARTVTPDNQDLNEPSGSSPVPEVLPETASLR